jgi:hypothetical protein
MSARSDLYRNLIRLLCGLDADPLEDLPMVPDDVIHFHGGLARPRCQQRLA